MGKKDLAEKKLEDYNDVFADMPIRVMGYDYGNYRWQLMEEKKPLHPVVTIVLNFSDRRWLKNKSLHELLQLSGEQKEYVQDYRIRVFDIAFLGDEVIEQFQSDFKVVARFFKKKRLGNEPFKGQKMTVKHAKELLELFSVFTGDRTYEEVQAEKA